MRHERRSPPRTSRCSSHSAPSLNPLLQHANSRIAASNCGGMNASHLQCKSERGRPIARINPKGAARAAYLVLHAALAKLLESRQVALLDCIDDGERRGFVHCEDFGRRLKLSGFLGVPTLVCRVLRAL